MMTGATQTLWAELIASTLADAGVRVCVVSPGSRSTPLVAALANDGRLALPTIIDERAAAFYALGAARATLDGAPVALVCTSGTAAAHYLPALVEASDAGALPASFRGREHVLALCRCAGYPLLAEAGSQLRFGARAGVTCVDRADLLLGTPLVPMPKLNLQLGAEPVAASWPALAGVPRRVLAASWRDPASPARVVDSATAR